MLTAEVGRVGRYQQRATFLIWQVRVAAAGAHGDGAAGDGGDSPADGNARVRRDRGLLMISARVTYDGGHFSHRYRATPSTRGKVQSLILRRRLTTAGAFLIRPPDGRSGDPHVSGATRSVEPEAQLWEGPQLRGPLLYLPPLLGGWHPARPQHLCEAVRLEIAGFTVSRRG